MSIGIGLAILVSMILYLIDRNQKWPQTWTLTKKILRVGAVLSVIGLIGAGIVYAISDYKSKKELEENQRQYAQQEKDLKNAKDAAIATAWQVLGSMSKELCGDNLTYVFGNDFPNSGEVACVTKEQAASNNTIYLSEASPVSVSGCTLMREKLPLTCKLAPLSAPPKIAKNSGRHLRVLVDTEIVNSEWGNLKVGSVKKDDVVTLLEEGPVNVKIKTADGQIGWASGSLFEAIQ